MADCIFEKHNEFGKLLNKEFEDERMSPAYCFKIQTNLV